MAIQNNDTTYSTVVVIFSISLLSLLIPRYSQHNERELPAMYLGTPGNVCLASQAKEAEIAAQDVRLDVINDNIVAVGIILFNSKKKIY